MDSENEPLPDRHPSYGMLQIHHVQGGAAALFGSSVTHQNMISLRVCHGHVKRDLSNNWFMADDNIVEIRMSPVQWAEAITNMNSGMGTPCTLIYINGEAVPDCPDNATERELINAEFKAKINKVVAGLKEAMTRVDELLKKKTLTAAEKGEIREAMTLISREFQCNVPFVQQQFNEAMEGVVAEAKGEIEAFYTMACMRAGMNVLAGKGPPSVPMLEHKGEVIDVSPECDDPSGDAS